MSWLSLAITGVFVLVALGLSLWQELRLERDLLIGSLRAALQLLAMGYLLGWIFALKEWPYVLLMLGLMIGVAAQNALKRGGHLPGLWWRVLVAIAGAEAFTFIVLLVFRIVPSSPRFVIPLSGMIIGNSMIAAALLLNQLRQGVADRRAEILVSLSLGATARQAISPVLRRSIRSALIPTVDNLKTVGLVQLPGMMTGLIVGGTSPAMAVRYQILIMYALTSAVALQAVVLGFLFWPLMFTPAQQLRPVTSRE